MLLMRVGQYWTYSVSVPGSPIHLSEVKEVVDVELR